MKITRLFLFVMSLFIRLAYATEAKNFEEVYRQKCDSVTAEFYGDDWCNPGNAVGKAPNTVLIGDSYSNSLNGMMEAYVAGNKGLIYEQYGRGQCPTLLAYGPDWCAGFAKTVYERVKRTPSIKTVLIAANWSYYWNDYWIDSRKASISDRITDREHLRAEFEKSLQDTLKSYQALGKRVVFIYQSPGIYDPKWCAQRRIQLSKIEDKCRLSREQTKDREEYRAYVTPLLQQLKVLTLDPYLYFCDTKECKLRDGEKIFNTTETHLSGFGGQYLAGKAAPELKKLLGY